MHARPTPHQHYASPVFWFEHRCDWMWRRSRDAVAGVSDRLGSAHRFVTLVLFTQRLLQLQCFCKSMTFTFIKCSFMKHSKPSQLSPPLNASGCSFFTVSFNCLKNQQREMLKENRVHNRVCGWYWWRQFRITKPTSSLHLIRLKTASRSDFIWVKRRVWRLNSSLVLEKRSVERWLKFTNISFVFSNLWSLKIVMIPHYYQGWKGFGRTGWRRAFLAYTRNARPVHITRI